MASKHQIHGKWYRFDGFDPLHYITTLITGQNKTAFPFWNKIKLFCCSQINRYLHFVFFSDWIL